MADARDASGPAAPLTYVDSRADGGVVVRGHPTDAEAQQAMDAQDPTAKFVEFFGPPRTKVQRNPLDRWSRETFSLPEVYHGENSFLTVMLIEQLTASDLALFRYVMPVRDVGFETKLTFTRISFDSTSMPSTPEESASRLVSMSREQHTEVLTRRGLALMLEHGFMRTPQGKAVYAKQLAQIRNATLDSMLFTGMERLLNCRLTAQRWFDAYGSRMMPNRVAQAHIEETERFAILQKSNMGWELLDGLAKQRLEVMGRSGDTWLVPRGMLAWIAVHRGEAYFQRGENRMMEAMQKGAYKEEFNRRNNCTIHEIKAFAVPGSLRPIQIMSRNRTIGDYFTMTGGSETSAYRLDGRYASYQRNIFIYSETEDTDIEIDILHAIKCTARFDSGGAPLPAARGSKRRRGGESQQSEDIFANLKGPPPDLVGAELTLHAGSQAGVNRFGDLGKRVLSPEAVLHFAETCAAKLGSKESIKECNSALLDGVQLLLRCYPTDSDTQQTVSDEHRTLTDDMRRFYSMMGMVKLRENSSIHMEREKQTAERLLSVVEKIVTIVHEFAGSDTLRHTLLVQGHKDPRLPETLRMGQGLLAMLLPQDKRAAFLFDGEKLEIDQELKDEIGDSFNRMSVVETNEVLKKQMADVKNELIRKLDDACPRDDQAKKDFENRVRTCLNEFVETGYSEEGFQKMLTDLGEIRRDNTSGTQIFHQQPTDVEERTAPAFEDYEQMFAMKEPVIKVFMYALLFQQFDLRALQKFYEMDLAIPFDVELYRPFATYEMQSAVLLKSGKDTAETLISEANFQLGDDPVRKIHIGNFTCRMGAVVYEEENVYVARDVLCVGYHGGCNANLFDSPEAFSQYVPTYDGPSVFARLVPYKQASRLPVAVRISGSMSGGPVHGPAQDAWFQDTWGLTPEAETDGVSPFDSADPYNTLCFRGYQRSYSPETGQFSNRQNNTGHWGPNVFPGVARYRSGLAGAIPSGSETSLPARSTF